MESEQPAAVQAEQPQPQQQLSAAIPPTMKAWVYRKIQENPTDPFPLELNEAYPTPDLKSCGAGYVLARVAACTINPVDWKVIQGSFRYVPAAIGGPAWDSKNGTIPCADGSGVVVASTSPSFKVGDEIVWDNHSKFGSLAEYCLVSATRAALKPKNMNLVDASANVGLASGTAVTGCDWMLANLPPSPGKVFLVLGGAGGVGSSAICYLTALGHKVVTTASERNAEWCRRLGAVDVIDYHTRKFTELGLNSIDGIFQCVGMPEDFDLAPQVLKPPGVFASCNRGEGNSLVGAIFSSIGRKFFQPIKYNAFLNNPSTANLAKTVHLIETTNWPNNIGKTFPFAEAREAFALSMSSKATGKLVITLQ